MQLLSLSIKREGSGQKSSNQVSMVAVLSGDRGNKMESSSEKVQKKKESSPNTTTASTVSAIKLIGKYLFTSPISKCLR